MTWHRAAAIVDLDAIVANAQVLDRASGDAELMAVVKADAYGHGVARVAPALRASGVPWLGVALPSEAVELRSAGDRGRILAWLWVPGDPLVTACIDLDIDLGVSSREALQQVSDAARIRGGRARVHLKIDTGLSRNGVPEHEWEDLVRAALDDPRIDLVGVWSHLARADEPDVGTTDEQAERFTHALDVARSLGAKPEHVHLANSAGILAHAHTHHTLVRSGIGLYGVTPGPGLGDPRAHGLRPAMEIRARLALVKRIPAGAGVGYGHTWIAPDDTTVGLVPLGYSDGIPRASNGAWVSVAGRRAPVIGRVAMDQFVVHLGEAVPVGTEVEVLGPNAMDAEEWGHSAGTIGYEVVTRIGSRLPRHYRGDTWT
jgi:alanine racemase